MPKEEVLSVRISKHMRDQLAAAALKNRRKLSREVEARLEDSLGRYQKFRTGRLPPHVRALANAVEDATWGFEAKTGLQWNQDQFTSQHLARGISRLIALYTLPGKVTIPQKLLKWAELKPPKQRKAYLDNFGEEEIDGIIAWFKAASATPKSGGLPYPEWYARFDNIERDLKSRRQK
jgi:TraY domain